MTLLRLFPQIIILAGVLLAGFVSPVRAQSSDMTPLLNRLDRLERDISTLGRQLAREGVAPVGASAAPSSSSASNGAVPDGAEPAVARLGVHIAAIEEEVRALTGRTESLTFRMDEILRRLDKLVSDVDYRLSRMEQGSATLPKITPSPSPPSVQTVPSGASAPTTLGSITQGQLEGVTNADETEAFANATGATPSTNAANPSNVQTGEGVESAALPPADTSILPEGSVKERYQFAFNLLRKARYSEAEEALRAFLRLHGGDDLASNARYWLGETFYVRGDYAHAAEIFFDGYQKEPKGPKAPDTLLKLGMSLAGLDKKAEACATYGKLEEDFKDLSGTIKKALERERKRDAC